MTQGGEQGQGPPGILEDKRKSRMAKYGKHFVARASSPALARPWLAAHSTSCNKRTRSKLLSLDHAATLSSQSFLVESLGPRSGVYFATQASSGMVGMHRNMVAGDRLVGCSIYGLLVDICRLAAALVLQCTSRVSCAPPALDRGLISTSSRSYCSLGLCSYSSAKRTGTAFSTLPPTASRTCPQSAHQTQGIQRMRLSTGRGANSSFFKTHGLPSSAPIPTIYTEASTSNLPRSYRKSNQLRETCSWA